MEQIVSGLIVPGTLSLISGQEGTHPDLLAKHLAVSTATGKSFLGRDTKKGAVLLVDTHNSPFVAYEDLQDIGFDLGSSQRAKALDKYRLLHKDNLWVLATQDGASGWPLFGSIIMTLGLYDMEPKPSLIIIDSLPVKNYMRTEVIEDLRGLLDVCPETAIVFTHPCNKRVGKDPFDAIKGSVTWRSESNTEIVMWLDKQGKKFIESMSNMGKSLPKTELMTEWASDFRFNTLEAA